MPEYTIIRYGTVTAKNDDQAMTKALHREETPERIVVKSGTVVLQEWRRGSNYISLAVGRAANAARKRLAREG